MELLPIEQTSFDTESRTLRDKIAACGTEIHAAGFASGAEPQSRPPNQSRRSYAQLEFETAIALDKPTFVFLATEGFPFDPKEPEPVGLIVSASLSASRTMAAACDNGNVAVVWDLDE